MFQEKLLNNHADYDYFSQIESYPLRNFYYKGGAWNNDTLPQCNSDKMSFVTNIKFNHMIFNGTHKINKLLISIRNSIRNDELLKEKEPYFTASQINGRYDYRIYWEGGVSCIRTMDYIISNYFEKDNDSCSEEIKLKDIISNIYTDVVYENDILHEFENGGDYT